MIPALSALPNPPPDAGPVSVRRSEPAPGLAFATVLARLPPLAPAAGGASDPAADAPEAGAEPTDPIDPAATGPAAGGTTFGEALSDSPAEDRVVLPAAPDAVAERAAPPGPLSDAPTTDRADTDTPAVPRLPLAAEGVPPGHPAGGGLAPPFRSADSAPDAPPAARSEPPPAAPADRSRPVALRPELAMPAAVALAAAALSMRAAAPDSPPPAPPPMPTSTLAPAEVAPPSPATAAPAGTAPHAVSDLAPTPATPRVEPPRPALAEGARVALSESRLHRPATTPMPAGVSDAVAVAVAADGRPATPVGAALAPFAVRVRVEPAVPQAAPAVPGGALLPAPAPLRLGHPARAADSAPIPRPPAAMPAAPARGADGALMTAPTLPAPDLAAAALPASLLAPAPTAGPAAPGPSLAAQIAAALPPPDAPTPRPATADLVLSPAELGRVQIRYDTTDGQAVLHLTVERPETLDLMRRHLDLLTATLREFGHAGCAVQLSGRDPEGFGQGPQSRPAPQPPEGEPALPGPDRAAADLRPRPGPGSARLDLRL